MNKRVKNKNVPSRNQLSLVLDEHHFDILIGLQEHYKMTRSDVLRVLLREKNYELKMNQ